MLALPAGQCCGCPVLPPRLYPNRSSPVVFCCLGPQAHDLPVVVGDMRRHLRRIYVVHAPTLAGQRGLTPVLALLPIAETLPIEGSVEPVWEYEP